MSREQVPFVQSGEALPDMGSRRLCIEGDLVFADASEGMNDVGKTMEIVRLHSEQVLAGQHTILASTWPHVGYWIRCLSLWLQSDAWPD